MDKMNQIKISIVVPVYNLQDEIVPCVNSIRNQTHNNLEIILVDDGSQDNSRKKIQELAKTDERIHPIYKCNGGVTSARLTGIVAATGDWIGFVDGDDYIEPDMYEFLLRNAVNYNTQISHCGYQMCFPDGRVNYFHNTGCLAEQDSITALKELLSGERIEPGLCNKLFHKSLFHSLLHENVMDFDIKINEDLLMNYYLFKMADKSVFEDRCPYHYLVRYSSTSRQKMNVHKIYDPIKVKKIIMDDSANGLETISQKVFIGTCINVYNSLISAGTKEYSEDLRTVQQIIKENRNLFCVLSAKWRISARLISWVPHVYQLAYIIYSHLFQKKKYC